MFKSVRSSRRRGAAVVALAALALAASNVLTSPAEGAAPPPRNTDACGTLISKPTGGNWQCTFVDNFDGGALNTNKWVVSSTARSGFRSGLTCYRSSSKNVVVRQGTVQLVAHDEGAPFTCTSPYGSFTTRYSGGAISTWGKFSQTYGRFEARAKYPTTTTQGAHAAFWLYPQKDNYGSWPASGEIDVAEWWSVRPDLTMPSLHYSGRDLWADSGWDCVVADATTWHTYAVDWSTTAMTFSIDGVPCFTRSWSGTGLLPAPAPFDRPFTMALTSGVGDETGTNIVSAATTLPASYIIDYVKVWR